MPGSTPEERMTGRKKIARARVLPLNFWLRMTAMTKESTSVATELISILGISSTRRML